MYFALRNTSQWKAFGSSRSQLRSIRRTNLIQLAGVVNSWKKRATYYWAETKERHVINPEVLADDTYHALAAGSSVRAAGDRTTDRGPQR